MISRSSLLLTKQLQRSASVGLARGFADLRSERTEFQRINSNVNVGDRITNSKNLEEALSLAQNSSETLTVSGAISILKSITKLYQNSIAQEFTRLRSDNRYIAIINRVKENLDSLTNNDIQDFLFIMRKFSGFDCSSGFSMSEIEKVKLRIIRDMQQDEIPPKTLVHAYYNLCCIQFDTSLIANYLLKKIRENPMILNSYHYSYLIMAVSSKPQNSSHNDFLVADEAAKIIMNFTDEFDNSKKCDIFHQLARIELHLNSPNMQVPLLLYKLKNTIKESLDKLSEQDILMMVEAHRYLPPHFPNDLLNEFKSMVQVTLQHNATNLKTNFLINFLKLNIKLNKARRLGADTIKLILETLIKRFTLENLVSSNILLIHRNTKMYKLSIDSLALQIMKYLDEVEDSKREKEVLMLEYLIDQGKSVNSYIEKFINIRGDMEVSVNSFRRLVHALKCKPTTENRKCIELLESHPIYSNETMLSISVLKGLMSESDSYNSLKVLEKTLSKLVGTIEPVEMSSNQIDVLIQSANTFESVNTLFKNEQYKELLSTFSPQRIQMVLNKFSSLEQATPQQFNFLLRFLILNKPKLIARRLIIFMVNIAVDLSKLSHKNDQLFLRVMNFIISVEDISHTGNINSIFQLTYKLNEYGVRNDNLNSLLLECFIKSKKENKVFRLNVEVEIAKILINSELLPIESAIELYEKVKDKQRYKHSDEQEILCHILRSKKINGDQRLQFEEAAKAKITDHLIKLNELDPKVAIQAFRDLIPFPPELLEEHRQKLTDVLRDHIPTMNSKTFNDLLSAFPPQRLSRNFDFYFPLIKELFSDIVSKLKKLRPASIVQILQLCASINLKNIGLFNNILTEIGNSFPLLKNSELIHIISSFSNLGLKQTDFYDRVFSRLLQESYSLTNAERVRLIISFYVIGYDSTLLKSKLLEYASNRKGFSLPTLGILVPYILNLNLENERKVLEDIFAHLQTTEIKKKLAYLSSAMIAETILKLRYPDTDFAENFGKIFNKEAKKFTEKSDIFPQSKFMAGYLDSMSVKYEQKKELEGFNFPFYLPDQNLLVILMQRDDINFDKVSLRGRGLLNACLAQEIAAKNNMKVIILNIPDFLQSKDDMARVLYLESRGVISQTAKDKYDFSTIPKKNEQKEDSETPKTRAEDLPVDEKDLLSEDEDPTKPPKTSA